MPAVTMHVRWPDGSRDACYSPSTIVRTYFVAGTSYPLDEFTTRAGAAMEAASERVRAVHGARCMRAAATRDSIEARAGAFTEGSVTIERFEQEHAQ